MLAKTMLKRHFYKGRLPHQFQVEKLQLVQVCIMKAIVTLYFITDYTMDNPLDVFDSTVLQSTT